MRLWLNVNLSLHLGLIVAKKTITFYNKVWNVSNNPRNTCCPCFYIISCMLLLKKKWWIDGKYTVSQQSWTFYCMQIIFDGFGRAANVLWHMTHTHTQRIHEKDRATVNFNEIIFFIFILAIGVFDEWMEKFHLICM